MDREPLEGEELQWNVFISPYLSGGEQQYFGPAAEDE